MWLTATIMDYLRVVLIELTSFPETRAETHPKIRHYCNGWLRLSQKPWSLWPDGFPETRLSRNQGSDPARKPALPQWVTEAFSENTVTRWVSKNPAFQKSGENPFGKHGLLRWITAAFSVTTVTSRFPTRYFRNRGLSNP